MPRILDVEQSLLLLELQAPFDQRSVQLARRQMAKRWHPDIAPPGSPSRARAASAGHQRGRRPARAAGGDLAGWARVRERGPRVRGGREEGARGGRPPRLRGRATRPGRRGGPGPARPVRRARARPLGRPSLRALRLLPGVGCRDRNRDLLLRRRGGGPAVGPRQLLGRGPHDSGGLAALRGLFHARPGRRPGAAVHDGRTARAGGGRPGARGPAARVRARRRAEATPRCCGS